GTGEKVFVSCFIWAMTRRIARVYLAVVPLGVAFPMPSAGMPFALPVARHVVVVRTALFPAVRTPGIAGPAVDVAASDPDIVAALPTPIARHPHIGRSRCRRRGFVDHGGRRRDGQADIDAHADLRERRRSCS